ncbi:MAG: CoA-binding protein, partial [Actinomycetota bacterium]
MTTRGRRRSPVGSGSRPSTRSTPCPSRRRSSGSDHRAAACGARAACSQRPPSSRWAPVPGAPLDYVAAVPDASQHRLHRMLAPRSVALVGASTVPNAAGNDMVLELLQSRFPGRVFPVNPRYSEVEGFECHPSLSDLPESPDVVVLGIDANRQDSLTELAAYGRRHGIEFPLLKDNSGIAVDRFGAVRTPEAFVLDRDRVIRYRGRIDDQYDVGVLREAPTQNFVRLALDSVLDGDQVSTPETRAVGCFIGRPREPDPNSAVTYSEHVAPILEQHCVECHRDGEIAPFALRDYDEVAGWADTIAEVVRDQRMPPWHANPHHGEFSNARLLTDAEKQTLYQWAEAAAPQGDPALAPKPQRFVEGWRLPREPDLVVPMRDTPYRVAS